jgi:alkylation response protein AidB-like acyl-CoA dehydrogenase
MSRRDLDFLLYEWLGTEALFERTRFAEHDRDTAAALLDLAEELATELFATHNRAADLQEPTFDGTTVTVHPDVAPALAALADAGFLAAPLDASVGGHQLPVTVANACMAWFEAANAGTSAYALLTLAAARFPS